MNNKRYSELCARSNERGEKGDCAVKAVAIALDLSSDEAHTLCAEYGRKPRDGMMSVSIHAAIRSRGAELRRVNVTAPTVRALQRMLPNEGVFIAHIADHILSIKDGLVQDWSRGRLGRIMSVYEVIPKNRKKEAVKRIGGMYTKF